MSHFEEIKHHLAKILQVHPSIFTKNSSIRNVSAWDSLAHMKILMLLEEKYGVVINQELFEETFSLEGICNILLISMDS